MKTLIISQMLLMLSLLSSFGQSKTNLPPVIDMHLHVYTPENYWGGNDFQSRDTILESPISQTAHMDAVIDQIKKYNIVKTYASGNFEALDIIKNSYPDLFLPSAEIWPTQKLLKDTEFLKNLEKKSNLAKSLQLVRLRIFIWGLPPMIQ